ncbi:MAG: response regulator [Treponema sp.]|nr:response regulator [Treponema sp.]
MYNVLITDDEQIVIDSLEFIMNKDFPDQIKVFSALSGTEAIEITTKEKIDIVFMDIHMSGINGLETVSCILRLKPETVIIMLSAYDRFQYAQEAINIGAFKYITKPVNRNLVVQTVREAMNQVDKMRGQFSSDQELHKKLDLISPMVESDFIYSCIFSNEKNTDVSTFFEYFNITETHWCFCCIELPGVTTENQFQVYSNIRTLLNSHCKCLLGSFMSNRLVIFFPISVPSEITPAEAMKNDVNRAFNLIAINISQKVRAGVSIIQQDTGLMSQSYNQALEALNRTDKDGGIIFYSGEEEELSPIENSCERILGRLGIGDGAGVKYLTAEYINNLYNSGADINKIKNLLFELLIRARDTTNNLSSSLQKTSYSNDAFDSIFGFFSTCNERVQIEDFVQQRLFECASHVTKIRTKKENPVIKKVTQYVLDNLSKELSLDNVAQTVNMSSFYLSKMFKEETGETFINYVTDRRLEKSCTLLKETEKSVKEITADVGYNDQNYFSKLFKNKYGLSPTEFRNNAEEKK